MRCYYLLSEISKYAEVDLVALNQENLIKQYFPSVEDGNYAAREELSKFARKIQFFKLDHGDSTIKKYILALKCLFSKEPYSVRWFESAGMAKAISEAVANNQYDIIHIDTIGLAQYNYLFQNSEVVKILDHHNIESHMMLRRAKKTNNPIKKLYFYLEGKKIAQYEKKKLIEFQMHITCSDLDCVRLKEVSPTIKAETIPNPVDSASHKMEEPYVQIGNPKLLYLGGLDWYPNLDAMIHFCKDIWPGIVERNSSISLDIVGKNPPAVLTVITKQFVNIRLHGYVPSINEFYKNALIFICPIRDGGGTKLKVLDAMGHGKLVVGYPEAFEGLDVEDGKNCIIASDAIDMQNKIIDVVDGKYDLNYFGKNAKELIDRVYDKKVVGKKMRDLYDSLIR